MTTRSCTLPEQERARQRQAPTSCIHIQNSRKLGTSLSYTNTNAHKSTGVTWWTATYDGLRTRGRKHPCMKEENKKQGKRPLDTLLSAELHPEDTLLSAELHPEAAQK